MDADIYYGIDSPDPLSVPAQSDSYYSHSDTLTKPVSFTTYGNPRWNPASPRALARLLEDVPPRETPSPGPLLASEGQDAGSESGVSSPTVGGSSGSDQGGPTSLTDQEDVPLTVTGLAPARLVKVIEDGIEAGALRDSIRGIWKLWETGRRKHSALKGADATGDKELFLEIVKDVISLS